MNFKNYFIWLKYTIYTPSFFWRNRLFIEKLNKNDHVYSFFGETQKSFTWLKSSKNNSAPFWFQTSQWRIVIWSLVLFILFFNLCNLNGIFGIYHNMYYVRLLEFKFWRFFDLFILNILQLHFIISSWIISMFFYSTKLITYSTLNLNKWLTWFHAGLHHQTNTQSEEELKKLINYPNTSLIETNFAKINKQKSFNYLKFIKSYYIVLKSTKSPAINFHLTNRIANFNDEIALFKYKPTIRQNNQNFVYNFNLNTLLAKLNTQEPLLLKNLKLTNDTENFSWNNKFYFKDLYLNLIKEKRFIFKNLNLNNADLTYYQNFYNNLPITGTLNSIEWKIFRDNYITNNLTNRLSWNFINFLNQTPHYFKTPNQIKTLINLELIRLDSQFKFDLNNKITNGYAICESSKFRYNSFTRFFFYNDSIFYKNTEYLRSPRVDFKKTIKRLI